MPLAERFLTHRVESRWLRCATTTLSRPTRLQESVRREGSGWSQARCWRIFGPVAGGELMRLGFLANENLPKLRAFDAIGQRIDEVEFHPAYHRLMQLGVEHGVPNFSWRNEQTPGAHVARAALAYLAHAARAGPQLPADHDPRLRAGAAPAAALAREWLPRVLTPHYDGRCLPAHESPATPSAWA